MWNGGDWLTEIPENEVEQIYMKCINKPCLMMTSPGSMERLVMASMQNLRADDGNEANKKCSCKYPYALMDQGIQ